MHIHFDGEPIKLGPFKTFPEYADALEDLAQERHRVITAITVDGRNYEALDSLDLASRSPNQIGLVEVGTENPRKLSISILYDTARFMPRLSKAFERVAELIQRREDDEAMSLLQEALSTWMELTSGMQGAMMTLGYDLDEIEMGEETLDMIYGDILALLSDVTESLEGGDLVDLSDLLEYELAPRLLQVEEGLYILLNKAEQKLH